MATVQELERALINADASGDTQAASILAQEIQRVQQARPAPKDSSMSTAFKHSELQSRANTLEYTAAAEKALGESFLGDFTRFGRENIGNPVREALGFEPIDTDAVSQALIDQNMVQAGQLRQQADQLNYKSLTTDDIDGLGTGIQYVGNKMAEMAPTLAQTVAAPVTMPLPLMGEAYQEVKDTDSENKVALATGAGVVMTLLNSIGAKGVLKGMTPSTINALGVQGAANELRRRGARQAATDLLAAAAKEGITEAAEDVVQMTAGKFAGKEYSANEIYTRLKESAAAGFAGGGGMRVATQTPGAVLKAAESVSGSSLKSIHQGDTEALADVSRDIENLSAQYPDRKPTKNLSDADQTLKDLHTEYMKRFDTLRDEAKLQGADVKSAEFKTAEKRAKNLAKNEASSGDVETLSQINPELGALARKLNILTRFNKQGIKGGVSRYTDAFSITEGLRKLGTFGRSQGLQQTGVATGLTLLSGGSTTALAVGGRALDYATQSRNRVKTAVKKFKDKPGINLNPAQEQQQTQQTPVEGQRGNLAPQQPQQGQQNVDNPQMPQLSPGTTGADPVRRPIRSQESYDQTVRQAGQVSDLAVQNAPTPVLQARALSIAAAKNQASKQELINKTYDEFPEHAEYIIDFLLPLGNFGPKNPPANAQQSRFTGVPGSDIIQEEMDAAQALGERQMILHHGTSLQDAETIDREGFGTPIVYAAADPRDADSFAQVKLDTASNGRVSIMMPETQFDQMLKNGVIKRQEYKTSFGRTITEYMLSPNALAKSDVFRTRSLHKAGNPITNEQRTQLLADALGNGFNAKFNASDDAYYRRHNLITLTADGDRVKTLHEIFHAVENRLTENEMNTMRNHPIFNEVMAEVDELYSDLPESAKFLEGLAETSARLQNDRLNGQSIPRYIVAKIRDLIEAFKNLIEGNGFNSVNSVLDDIYTGKTYQKQINQDYADLYVPDIAYAKKDKAGGPMVAKRLKALEKIETDAARVAELRKPVNQAYDEAMENIANNLGIEGVTGRVLQRMFSRITPNTEIGMVAADFLRGLGVMNDDGMIKGVSDADAVAAVVNEYRDQFLTIIKALQKAKVIGDFGLAFRTSAGGVMYPVHMIEPTLPALVDKADLNNVSKFENRAKPTHPEGKIKIKSHPFGSYENTTAFIEREQKQALVINDKIYEMMDKMQSTPQTHRGLDLIYKKDGTTDSAYTLASAEALKQYKDNQNESGGMSPLFMRRQAQDRLRVDTLNGSASYQGKAGKAIWEFPNWEAFGPTGFESFLHSLRDHFGISNEMAFNQRAGFVFGTVREYLESAGRPITEAIPESDLDMPLIDYMVNAYGQTGSYLYSHTRGGTPKLFLDKQSGVTLYQKNHAIFDVAEHGFEMQRAAIELGRMRAFLENKIPEAKKMSSSELFQMPEALEALEEFKSSYPTWFDGTSSSYQLHAVLTGDANLALETNLSTFDPDGPGGDLYRPGAQYLQELTALPQTKTRKVTKKFIANRRSYGQVKLTAMKSGADELAKSLPEFAERTETGQWTDNLKEKLRMIQTRLEADFDSKFMGSPVAEGIARAVAQRMFEMQGADNFAVRVPLPDGDIAVYTGKMPDSAKRRVTWEIDKEKKAAVPVYMDKKSISGFAAFLNHALDAYVQRELAKRLRAEGVSGFMHTHDAFATHAKNGMRMRELYYQIMREIASMPVYRDILQANGLDPANMNVKFNITDETGGKSISQPMLEVLDAIDEQKSDTFGRDEDAVNYYALS